MSEEQKIVEPVEGAEPTEGQPTAEELLAQLQAKLAQAEAQAAEYKDQYLRAAADYKNFKRRVEIERNELIRSAGADLILKLLPVVDDFDRAVASVPPEIAATPWWGGTQLIAHKLRLLLESQNVKAVEALGQEFDPNLHEAVLYEEAEGQDGKVIEELQKGYKLGERVLRPAMVKVGRG
jgi:molecular chaperone GrpE